MCPDVLYIWKVLEDGGWSLAVTSLSVRLFAHLLYRLIQGEVLLHQIDLFLSMCTLCGLTKQTS
jgi:hypothetical protein